MTSQTFFFTYYKLSPSSPPSLGWYFTLGCLYSQQPLLPDSSWMIRVSPLRLNDANVCRHSSNVAWRDEQHLLRTVKCPVKYAALPVRSSEGPSPGTPLEFLSSGEGEKKPSARNYKARTTAWTCCFKCSDILWSHVDGGEVMKGQGPSGCFCSLTQVP